MKHFILFTLFTLLLPLAACTEKDISGGEPPVGPQTGLRLSARLSQGVATRADVGRLQAHLDEKRIDRIAFFVHTDEDGLQIYPPAPDDGSTTIDDDPNSVHLAETAPDSRQYTADVVLTAGGGYMADIVAVANLPEDYDYRQIVSWDGLQDSVLVWATANMLPATVGNALEMPSCNPGTNNKIDDTDRRAFAMYGYTRHELVKEESNTFTLAMERLAARIDITNEAYVKGMTDDDPKGGFRLSSVRLLHTRPASYITPQADYTSPDVVTVSDWQVTDIPYGKEAIPDPDTNPTGEPDKVEAADAEASATLQYLWRTLYTYENSDTEHAPTALEIKGAFRGMEVTRRIDFINKDKQPVPIVRNHRYLVRILPAPGLTDITFDIKVSEWDAVDTVNVKPDQTEVPVISNMESNLTEYINSEGQKTYDLYYTQDGEITFDATCSFAPGVRVKYYNDKTGTWTTDDNWITISKTAEEVIPVTRSTNTYKCSYKVTFPKFDTGLSRQAMLLVHNGGSEVECDTIRIRHTVTFPGTDLEPFALGTFNGKDIVWAPVNLGATKIPTRAIEIPDNDISKLTEDDYQKILEQSGLYFQWGRKSALNTFTTDRRLTMKPGPVSLEVSENEEYKDFLIDGGFKTGNWLEPSNDQLWNKGTADAPVKGDNDPCPSGWRISCKAELEVIAGMEWSHINSLHFIKGSKFVLYVPVITSIVDIANLIKTDDESAYIFSSDAVVNDKKLKEAYILNCGSGVITYPRYYAVPIRCVQEQP